MDPTTYRTIAAPVRATVEDRRSVFECWLRRVDTEAAARAVVEEARTTHWDARHHCSAFVLGPAGRLTRSNDDGEPAGTAGTPMLEVLTGSGLRDVVAVVTRWFGGTLLGTGGLVRAYSEAVRQGVAAAEPVDRELVRVVEVTVGHADAGRVEHDLRRRGTTVADVRYGTDVVLEALVPLADLADLESLLAGLTSGRAGLALGGERWRDRP